MNANRIKLLDTLALKPAPLIQLKLQEIDSEDYSGVIWKTREMLCETGFEPSDEYLEKGVLSLKQYYAIALLDPKNGHAVSKPIDPFWHSHILFTKSYTEFSYRVMGDYMHHEPLDTKSPEQVRNVSTLWSYTLRILPEMFSYIDGTFWPEDQSDNALICLHQNTIYGEILDLAMFPEVIEGQIYAF